MNRDTLRSIEEYRRHAAGPLENNLIDELVGGEMDRTEFLRRGAMFGLAAGVMGGLLGLAGEAVAAPGSTAQLARAKAGGTLRLGIIGFGGSLEPYKLAEGGSLGLAGIPGEYLTYSDLDNRVQPWLATRWKPNEDATVWTFQLRKGVKFHTGKEMTAADVVATFKVATGNKQSQALSVFAGILKPEGISARGRYAVVFRLEQPTGVFPYLVSQTTYQALVQPAALAANPDSWVANKMIGTGPFKLVSYVEKKSARLVRHDAYWGGRPPLDGVNVTLYQGSAPMVLALRAGQIDLASQLSAQEGQPFKGSSKFKLYQAPTAGHRQFCLRVDRDPFRDPRVRRAIALTLDRPAQIDKLLLGAGTLGNDSPFWTKYPSTDPSTKQRTQNLTLAKALLKAAGQESPKFTITTHKFLELADYGAAVQAFGREAGMDISLEVQSDKEYYGGGDDYYATTPWINRPSTITEWGARGVPNVYVIAAYLSDGIWNASHYKNPQFDSAAKEYLKASDLRSQRKATKLMAGLLLRDTPVVTSYFITFVGASSSKVLNYVPEGISHVRLAKVGLA